MKAATIGWVGMTHLGLNSSVAGAEKGFPTICFDPDTKLIENLEAGRLPVSEPDLAELLAEYRDAIRFTSAPADLEECDVVYIAPDVPTNDRGESDLTEIRRLLTLIQPHIGEGTVLVVLSQVPPGFTREFAGPGRHLYYQVETLIFGDAMNRARFPERYIVGCADPSTPLPESYRRFLESGDCPILPMRYESAELAKISINCCLVSSISVANTLAEICEQIGADWSEIVPALKLDRRIGPYSYLKPGLGIAGGNLERDLATVLRFAEANSTDGSVVAAWVGNSRHRKDWAYQALELHVLTDNPTPRISVLGLAYKENTHSTKNSPSLFLLERLGGHDVTVFDPTVPASAAPGTKAAESAMSAIENADVVIVMTPWPEFRDIEPQHLADSMKGRTIIDPYRVFDEASLIAAGFNYVTLGVPKKVPGTIG